jgi:23S rRNA pseudouridine1911/1915/1917 synthase
VKEVVPAALDGERVDRVVSLLSGVSRAAAADLVAGGSVQVDGTTVTMGKQRLHEGQVVDLPDGTPVACAAAEPDATVAFDVVFADDDVIVVDKPPGLVVHPGAAHHGGTLVNGLLARFPDLARVGGDEQRPGIVHRLDAGTSGLLVVARSERAYESLAAELAAHTARRHYLALAWGVPEARRGTVDAPIGRSAREPTRMTVSATGRAARTHYEIEREFTDPVACSLWRCRLETGRTHQIRVHLAAIGSPILGDRAYGGGGDDAHRLGLVRPFLHAWRLSFTHPTTHETVALEEDLPEDLRTALELLRDRPA